MTRQIAVLMTTFNRPNKTESALRSLFDQRLPSDIQLTVFVADASTNDLTTELCARYSNVVRIPVSSDTFWAGGMKRAYTEACNAAHADFFFWLNDDVTLGVDCLNDLVQIALDHSGRAIVGGALHDSSGVTSYTGYHRGPVRHRLALTRVHPADRTIHCDALNGNVVLVPAIVDKIVGGFPSGFVHAMADLHFTLRARTKGIEVLLAPGYVGACDTNSVNAGWGATGLSYRERWKRLLSPKGLPPRSWLKFCLTNGGITGFATFSSPYVRVLFGKGPG